MADFSSDSIAETQGYFRNTLLELDSHIDNDTLADLKFLLRDYVPSVALERIDSGRDLFTQLEKKGHLSNENRNLLAECLWRVGLGGYLYLLDENPQRVEQRVGIMGQSSLSPYRRLLYMLASELNYEDVKRLLYQLNVKKAKADSITTGAELFVYLEKMGLINSQQLDKIKNGFEVLDRADLQEMVDNYLEEMSMMGELPPGLPPYTPSLPPSYRPPEPGFGSSKGGYPSKEDNSSPPPETPDSTHSRELGFPGASKTPPSKTLPSDWRADSLRSLHPEELPRESLMSLRSNPDDASYPTENSDPSEWNLPEPEPPGENNPMSMREARISLEPERGSEVSDSSAAGGVNPVVTGNLNDVHMNLDEYYRMDRNPRGICLIINNKTFVPPEDRGQAGLGHRHGSDVDAEKLEGVFQKLNFKVIRKDDLTYDGMSETLQKVANNISHENFDCFVCCILSHGVQDHIFGVDGGLVPIRDLLAFFKPFSCPGLKGKPKIFFIQACQGKEKQRGADIDQDAPYAEGSRQDPINQRRTPELIPNEADFLLGHATVPGFVSYRSRSSGSWYITKLTDMLDKYGTSKDLLSILTLVNLEVGRANADMGGGPYKQSPAPFFTLRKKVLFFPLKNS